MARYIRTDSFRASYAALPQEIKAKAIKAFKIFKDNPHHPSLRVRRIPGREKEGLWYGRVDQSYRFTFQIDGEIYTFRNIGKHEITDRNP